jgi:tetratricopeptide (TPR) repeat protein
MIMTDDRITVNETIPLPDVLRALTRELTSMTADRTGGFEPRTAELTVHLLIGTDAGEPDFRVATSPSSGNAGTTTHTLKLTLQPILGEPTSGVFAVDGVPTSATPLADTVAQSADPLGKNITEAAHTPESEPTAPHHDTDPADFEHTAAMPVGDESVPPGRNAAAVDPEPFEDAESSPAAQPQDPTGPQAVADAEPTSSASGPATRALRKASQFVSPSDEADTPEPPGVTDSAAPRAPGDDTHSTGVKTTAEQQDSRLTAPEPMPSDDEPHAAPVTTTTADSPRPHHLTAAEPDHPRVTPLEAPQHDTHSEPIGPVRDTSAESPHPEQFTTTGLIAESIPSTTPARTPHDDPTPAPFGSRSTASPQADEQAVQNDRHPGQSEPVSGTTSEVPQPQSFSAAEQIAESIASDTSQTRTPHGETNPGRQATTSPQASQRPGDTVPSEVEPIRSTESEPPHPQHFTTTGPNVESISSTPQARTPHDDSNPVSAESRSTASVQADEQTVQNDSRREPTEPVSDTASESPRPQGFSAARPIADGLLQTGAPDNESNPGPFEATASSPAGQRPGDAAAEQVAVRRAASESSRPQHFTTVGPIPSSTPQTGTPHDEAVPSPLGDEPAASARTSQPPGETARDDARSAETEAADGAETEAPQPQHFTGSGTTSESEQVDRTRAESRDDATESAGSPSAASSVDESTADGTTESTATLADTVTPQDADPADNPTAPIPRTPSQPAADSSAARTSTGSAYSDLDDEHAEVIARYEKILVDRERAMGPLHRHTLISAGNLARAYREAGLSSQAIDVYERVLTDSESTFGPQDLDTLIFRGSLARCYREAGRMVEAIDLYERTLADSEQGFGPEHKNTLTARHNLALAYREDGRLDDAIELYRTCLADSERLLGSNHRDTLITCDSLASCLREAGKMAKATALDERLLTARRRVLGPEHPDTLHSTVNLAADRAAANHPGDAAELYEQALRTGERVLGPDHPISERARIGLAHSYAEVGRAGEAADLFERLLADCERQLGPDHRHTLIARNNLAVAYHDAGRYAEAIEAHTRTADDRERLLGPDHPDTLKSREHLAYSYEAQLLARTTGPQIPVPQE